MRRPNTVPGLLLAAARIYLARPAIRRSLAAAALGIGVASGVAIHRHSCTSQHPTSASTPPAAMELLPAYGAGVCAPSGERCDAHESCGAGARCVFPVRVAVPIVPSDEEAGMRSTETWMPSVAYNGAGYGVAWVALQGVRTELFFSRIGRDGERLGTPLRVTDSTDIKVAPQLVAAGNGYGAVWTAEHGQDLLVYFARLSPEGKLLGAPVAIGGMDGIRFYVQAAWNGSEFGVAYYRFDAPASFTIEFARVSAEGRVLGAPRVVARDLFPTAALALTWTQNQYALAWNDYAMTADATDVKLLRLTHRGDPAKVVVLGRRDGLNGTLSLAAPGDLSAVVWQDESLREPRNRLWYASARGERVDVAARALTDGTHTVADPSLATAGDSFGLAFADNRNDHAELYFQQLNRGGVAEGPAVRVTESSRPARWASLASGPSEYGLAWQAGSLTDNAIYFTRLSPTGARVGREVRLSAP